MFVRTLCLVGLIGLIGCSGSGGGGGPDKAVSTSGDAGEGTAHVCVDEDGDGFGMYCRLGLDCDDTDPAVTDECRRCAAPTTGCPCEPGTMPMRCNPHYAKKTTMNGQTGTLVCSDGARYCRDSVYSDCEILFQYATFIADK
jgi:hypothetical protein